MAGHLGGLRAMNSIIGGGYLNGKDLKKKNGIIKTLLNSYLSGVCLMFPKKKVIYHTTTKTIEGV